MENNALDSLQCDFIDSSTDATEKHVRAYYIPSLLFILLIAIFYGMTIQSPKQNLSLFLIAILLLFSFLLISLQLAGKLKQIRKSEAALSEKLKTSDSRTSQLENQLSEARTKAEAHQKEMADARKELAESNLLFDNYNLQLEVTASELQTAKSETDAILATVKQGVFLIGRDGAIGSQYSEELKKIFQVEDFAYRNFNQILRPLIPENRYQTFIDYVQLLFNPRKNEKQLQRFNPLKCIELNFQRAEGGFEAKHIEFTFYRVMLAGEIKKVLVTAVNVSDRVRLEAQIREGEERREKQLELLCDILRVEPLPLRHFMDEAETMVDGINKTFRDLSGNQASEQTSVLLDKVNESFRLFHNLKSQATALGLPVFEKAIHQIENVLHELRRKPRLVNEDLLNVLVLISSFQTSMREASELIAKISGMQHSFGATQGAGNASSADDLPVKNTPSLEMMRSVEDLARTVAARAAKKVKIQWNLNQFDELPIKYRHILRDGVFQLVRNSIVHGIELPVDREHIGKDPCGTITVTLETREKGQRLRLCCRDDGAGLNAEAIRRHAVSEGLLTEAEAKSRSESDLYMLIFEPGFSTASKVTEDAGRGVGLDALHAAISGQLLGEIHMEFQTGLYCQFELLAPLP